MTEDTKRTWVEINLSSIINNMKIMKKQLPDNCKFLSVVKADAYGHGAVKVASELEKNGTDYFAVACLDEAEELRNSGIKLPILVLGYTPTQFAHRLAELDITQAVSNFRQACKYSENLEGSGLVLKCHIKLETGMGRTGFDVKTGNIEQTLEILKLNNLDFEGIFTHFAVSDELDYKKYTLQQFKVFNTAIEKIEEKSGQNFKIHHCTNSGAMVNYPQTYMDMVRPGLALYGMYPSKDKGNIELLSAMSLKSRIYAISEHEKGDSISYGCTFTCERKTKIAILPIGYADGLHRVLSNKMEVLVKGRRCKQVGRICMDMCMIDITDLTDVKIGDTVTIFGKDGNVILPVEEQAEKAGTISYELVCSVSKRIKRVYIS